MLSTKQEGGEIQIYEIQIYEIQIYEIQIYSAMIACMLILLYTGGQVTKRTFEIVCFYICGWATEEELAAHIEKLQPKAS